MGIVIWFGVKTGRAAKLFALASILAFFWSLSVFLIYHTKNILAVRASYAIGAFVLATMLTWVFQFLQHRRSFLIAIFAYGVALFFALASVFTPFLISSTSPNLMGGLDEKNGPLFFWFGVYFVFVFGAIFVRLLFGYFKVEKKEQKQIRLMLVGLFLYGFFATLFSFVLPFFGEQRLADFDVPSSLFFVGFVVYAMIKHRLMNIHLVAVQILTVAILGMILVGTFTDQHSFDFSFKFLQFGLLFVLMIFFARSVLLEVNKKEEFREMAHRLEKANEELKKLDEAKSEFVSLASHQLRTPLTSIKGFLEMLQDGSFGKTNKRQIPIMQKMGLAVEHLDEITEEILNLSRVDAGTLGSTKQKVDLPLLIEELLPRYEKMAIEKGLKFLVVLPKKKIKTIEIDEYRMKFALGALIDNAIRYTQKGAIKVSLRKIKKDLHFLVEDAGTGLSQEDKNHLFEKFYRGERQKKIYVDGVGIGLYLTKRIVELNGGKISLTNLSKGKGVKALIVI